MSNNLYNKLINFSVKILLLVRFKLTTNNLTSINRYTNIKELSSDISTYQFEVLNLFDNKISNLENLYKEDANKSRIANNCIC